MAIRDCAKPITRFSRVLVALLVCLPSVSLAQIDPGEPLPSQPLPANPLSGPWAAFPLPDPAQGLLKLDVVATTNTGDPVTGLTKDDFTLLDNGQPQKPVSFRAYSGLSGLEPPIDPIARVILVIDGVNLDNLQVKAAEKALQDFLRLDHGKLTHPVSIYFVNRNGISALVRNNSYDGEGLARDIASETGSRALLKLPESYFPTGNSCRSQSAANGFSLTALGKIVLEQRRSPGRKLLIWLSPGWPAAPSANCASGWMDSFDWITEFSARMREARIALYSASIWASIWPGAGAIPSDYVAAPKIAHNANSLHLSLPALALRSGGRVLNTGPDLASLIQQAAADAGAGYILTFDPPPASAADEYHDIHVTIARPGAEARTIAGYYDEPSLNDQLSGSAELATVDQFQKALSAAHGHRDAALADQLERTILTERLSGTASYALRDGLPGEKSRLALIAVADASAFLRIPDAEKAARPEPDLAAQRAMLSRTLDYLAHVIPQLPDFFATRTTTRFEPPPQDEKHKQNWKGDNALPALRFSSTVVENIRYRDGNEVIDPVSVQHKHRSENEESLDTRGTFGPILYTVIKDAAASTVSWSHWESRSGSERAVFNFVVPKENSHYSVSFCCMTDMNSSGVLNWITGYHGELAVDPETGAIMRLAVQADLEPHLPLLRADIMVTYHATDIGGRSFIVPVHSVAISRKRTVTELHEWGDTLRTFSPYITILNDVTFTNYHKFGSESRMLPGFSTVPDQ